MIRSLRHIAFGSLPRTRSLRERALAHSARVLLVATALVFFLDAINADILYAAATGDVRFEDNPLILDSATDSTSVAPEIGTSSSYARPTALHDHALGSNTGKIATHASLHFTGTTITEDVDSPTVLDGADTHTLTYDLRRYAEAIPPPATREAPTFDRSITFGCLLI